MKLYHGTTKDAAENIIKNGFQLTGIESSKQNARKYDGNCLYGFDNYDDAENFALDQGYDNQSVISFDVDDSQLISDPEYPDSSYIITTLDVNNIKLEWSQ